MPSLEGLSLPMINSADSTITLPFWLAGVTAALLLLFFILALFRGGLAGTLVLVMLLAAGIGGAWAWLEHGRTEERRVIEARVTGLDAQALASDSVLACLDGPLGETVEVGCERALFASPETVAAASSYVSARLALLADGTKLAGRDPELAGTLERTRRSLEQDRFGVVANVLSVRNGCTAERCDVLVLLHDPTRVRNNLKERTFDATVVRYAAAWSTRAPRNASAAIGAGGGPGTPLPPSYNLPSSASIPPVSIMGPEPSGASTNPPAEAPPAAALPQPPRRPATAQRPAPPPRPLPAPPAPAAPARP
jgi:hypothetical protein